MKSIGMTLAIVFLMALSQPAFAGAPLKGIDVKLGKNPGGGCAARTTDASGNVDFGVWPKGNYTVSVSPSPSQPNVHVVVRGATTGALEREVEASGADRAAPIAFSLDGTTPLKVSVASGRTIVGPGAVRAKLPAE